MAGRARGARSSCPLAAADVPPLRRRLRTLPSRRRLPSASPCRDRPRSPSARQEGIEAGHQPGPARLVVPDLVFDQGAKQDEPAGPLAAILRVEPHPGPPDPPIQVAPLSLRRLAQLLAFLLEKPPSAPACRRGANLPDHPVGGRRGMLIAMMSLLAPLRRPPPARRERPPRTGGPAESTRRSARCTRRDAVPRPRWRPPCS